LVRPSNFGRSNTFYGISGDDCFIVTERSKANKLKHAIESNSCDSGTERRSVGFGQVIKKVDVYEGVHIDFCSKLFIKKANRVFSCKNLRNVLFKSHTYTGGNDSLSKNVMEHSYLVGLSILLEATTSLEIAYGCMRMRIGKSWADKERLRAALLNRFRHKNKGITDKVESLEPERLIENAELLYEQKKRSYASQLPQEIEKMFYEFYRIRPDKVIC